MAIRIGTTEITAVGKIKLGTVNITKVYQGVNQIWPAGSTLEYVYTAVGMLYQYSTVYYNSTSDFNESSVVSPTITLSPASQTISVEVYDQGGMGVSITYYLNGAYQTTYSATSYISTGSISTASGNAYYFDIISGAF
jgi:hypothetical protein